jgi:hypothetical protein
MESKFNLRRACKTVAAISFGGWADDDKITNYRSSN